MCQSCEHFLCPVNGPQSTAAVNLFEHSLKKNSLGLKGIDLSSFTQPQVVRIYVKHLKKTVQINLIRNNIIVLMFI